MPKDTNSKDARSRRICIFCGGNSGSRITKEHIFGEWLKKFFPRDETTNHKSFYIEWPDESGPRPAREKWTQGQGHVGSKKLLVLCRVCNNERLSGLEDRAKSALPPLIVGDRSNLPPAEQSVLATWAAKTAMVVEHSKPIDSGIPQEARSWLLANMTPPSEKWFVWIAAYGGKKWRDLSIYQSRVGLSDAPVSRPSAAPHYAQATTFGVGHVLFCVVSSNSPAIEIFRGRETEGVLQVWPPQDRSILWPPRRVLNDDEANAVSNILENSGAFNHSLDPGANWTFAF